MRSFLHFFKNLLISIVLGKIVFFAFVLAPKVFKVLPRELAAQLQNSIFPAYYKLDLICFGALFLLICVFPKRLYSATFLNLKRFKGTQILIILGFLISLYSNFFLLPDMIELYESSETASRASFQEFHRLSVLLNSGILLMSTFLIYSSSE